MGFFGGISSKEKEFLISVILNISKGNNVSVSTENISDTRIIEALNSLDQRSKDLNNYLNELSIGNLDVEFKSNNKEDLIAGTLLNVRNSMKLQKETSEQQQREIDARMKLVDEMCIVSEVDLKGYITYVNDLHCEVSQYKREELMGQNQNIVRHPDMDKAVFKELWATNR